MNQQDTFKSRVYDIVSQIPHGRVMTYGDIATLCGEAHAARIVGGLAHFGPLDLPWQRVVNRFGSMASGYYGGKAGQKAELEREGVIVTKEYLIQNFEELRWRP